MDTQLNGPMQSSPQAPSQAEITPDFMSQNAAPAMPADEVHSFFHYFLEKKGDKCIRAQCIRCGLTRIKSFQRQRQHLLECTSVLPSELEHEPLPAATKGASSTQNSDASSLLIARGTPLRFDASVVPIPNGREGYHPGAEGKSHYVPHQSSQTPIPAGGNHPLSSLFQSPSYGFSTLPFPGSFSQNLAVTSHQYTWMSNHRSVPTEAFLQQFQGTQSVKTEPDTGQQGVLSSLGSDRNLQASKNEVPVASIEIEDDYDDSAMSMSSESEDNETRSDLEADSDEASGEVDERSLSNDEPDGLLPDEDEDDEDNDDDSISPRQPPADGLESQQGITVGRKRGPRPRGYPKGLKRGPRKAADPGPEFTAIQNEAMRVFIEEQDNTKAMRLILQAISVNPEIYSAHALLSEIYFAEGENQKAVDALYLGAHCAPKDPDIWQGVADACLRVVTVDREIALRQALSCYRQILEIDKNNQDAVFQRAAIYFELGNHQKAFAENKKLLETMPHNTSVIRQKAQMLADTKRMEEALQLCEASIAHGKGMCSGAEDEFSWPDIIVYADIFARCDQIDKAISVLKKLARWLVGRETEDYWDEIVEDDREWDAEDEPRRVEVDSFRPQLFPIETYGLALPLELRIKLGLCRLRLGLDDRIEALGHFEWLEPDNIGPGAPIYRHKELFLDIAKGLKEVKEHQEALRYYETLLAVDAYSDVSFWLQAGATSYSCGKKEQSRNCYEAAKRANPGCVEARLQLAMLYVELGDKVNALENAEEAFDLTTHGIVTSERRIYEKRNHKAARKAAERVLKIARRLGRPRIRKPAVPTPATIKRKQEAKTRREKKLATKIERQKKIYERKAKKKTLSSKSDTQRTTKIQQLYASLTEATPGMRNGNLEARATWIESAQEMLGDYCSVNALFPSEKHMRFEGYEAEDIRKAQTTLHQKFDDEQDGITAVRSGAATKYRGIPFTSWLDIFLETAILHAKSGQRWKDACYALLKTAQECSVWYHDPDAMLQIYTCFFACALELHDEHTLLFTVGRWFMKRFQFCTDAYRLFAAFNLFHTTTDGGKPTPSRGEYREPATQKFLMRQMRALDSLLPEDYNADGEEGPLPKFMRTHPTRKDDANEDDDIDMEPSHRPKDFDVVMLCLYGHILYAGDTFVSALNYFYRALTLDSSNTMALLSIALCYFHEMPKRSVEDRHMHVLNGMAVFEEYADTRLEQASSRGQSAVRTARQEIEFNRARIWQMLGFGDLAVMEYGKLFDIGRQEDPDEDWSMEAAFAAANIYASNGDPAMARHITEQYMVVE